MSLQPFLVSSGILAQRCVALTGDGARHVVVTQDDMIVHNGNSAESILERRFKRHLFNEIDTENYVNSFLFTHPVRNEVWFCYPTHGNTVPNKALIWNYREGNKGALSEADGITFQHAALGGIETGAADDWEADTVTWEGDETPWSNLERRRLILASPQLTKMYNMGGSISRDGVAVASRLQREGIAFSANKDGNISVDHEIWKLLDRLWPTMQGGPVTIRLGRQTTVNGPITWSSPVTYNPASSVHVSMVQSGRAVGIEIAGDGANSWRLDGYKASISPLGTF